MEKIERKREKEIKAREIEKKREKEREERYKKTLKVN